VFHTTHNLATVAAAGGGKYEQDFHSAADFRLAACLLKLLLLLLLPQGGALADLAAFATLMLLVLKLKPELEAVRSPS